MDYKKCNKVSTDLLTFSGFFLMGGFMLRSAARFANALLIIGALFLIASFVVKFKYWRCPHCKYPIPMSRLNRGSGKTYQCPDCKNELEMP